MRANKGFRGGRPPFADDTLKASVDKISPRLPRAAGTAKRRYAALKKPRIDLDIAVGKALFI